MRLLFDTCIISELISSKPNPRVIGWVGSQAEESIFLSVITIGEIRQGIEKLQSTKRKQKLTEWLYDDLLMRFQGRVLDLDTSVMLRWGKLVGQLQKTGKPMPVLDSLIAAIALEHHLTLVTRNAKDFKNSKIPILNPWI